ncbi:MAG: citrate lyase ACP [Planctomycetota bacterium]|nr:MAG: citrate lyase ACP [Planctomycetota bacterium]
MAAETSFQAGRRGTDARGDCWLGFTPAAGGGIELVFRSKLEALYGERTRRLLLGLLEEAGVRHGRLQVEDQGAYPFVLRARVEALLRQVPGLAGLRVEPEPEWAPRGPVQRQRRRRSRLYLPGNEPKYMVSAALHRPDAVILDLEDSVAPPAKADARALVRHALYGVDWGASERMLRVNQGEAGLEDVAALRDTPLHLILIPKVESAEQVAAVDRALDGTDILLMPILESALGIENAREIARASPRNVALTLGLEDLTADFGIARTREGHETLWARSAVILAAKACGLQAIDSVFGDVGDEEGLRRSVREAKALGFEGKGCVHPRQIRVVHAEFAPTRAETERACRIAYAFEQAQAAGLGVVSLGSRMIDPPVVQRALRVVREATEAGLLRGDWRAALTAEAAAPRPAAGEGGGDGAIG